MLAAAIPLTSKSLTGPWPSLGRGVVVYIDFNGGKRGTQKCKIWTLYCEKENIGSTGVGGPPGPTPHPVPVALSIYVAVTQYNSLAFSSSFIKAET